MPDQTIKHDNAFPGFLLILIPVAFFAVFLSIAWPFILGATLLLTGNSVWQSYQWTKFSQQVNPVFSQLVIEKQGEITPLELSARANISSVLANRYLNGKAVEFGGVSYQEPSGSQVYSFLTVGTIGSTLAEIPAESSITQKLAELDLAEPSAPANLSTADSTAPEPVVAEISVVEPIPTDSKASAPTVAEVSVAEASPADSKAPAPAVAEVSVVEVIEPVAEIQIENPTVPAASTELVVESTPVEPTNVVTLAEPTAPIETPIVETPSEPLTETVSPEQMAPTVPSIAKIEPPATPTKSVSTTIEPVTPDASNFTKALRDIFNHPPASTPEPEVRMEAPTVIDETPTTSLEIISQADLAKRLDVHASTIYKRRGDMSFEDWTRNRDPEGVAWGYSKETKEFYRIG